MSLMRVVVFVILLSTLGEAQQNPNLDIGLNPYGSYHGGEIDSVSVTNGNLSVHIPVASYPQRGSLGIDYFLIANSKNWEVTSYQQPNNPNPPYLIWTTNEISPYGVLLKNSLDIQVQRYRTVVQTSVNIYGYSITTPDGAMHRVSTTGSNTYRSVDASGFSLTIVPGPTLSRGAGDTAIVIDRKGNRYALAITYASQSQVCPASFQKNTLPPACTIHFVDTFDTTSVTDTDGNTVQLQPTALSTVGTETLPSVDTLGRTLMQPVAGASPCYLYNTPVFGASTGTIKTCYSGSTFQTNFNQPNVGEATVPSSLANINNFTPSLMTSVVLPNNTSWIFSYDQYGDLTAVTLPTGGQISYTWQTIPLCSYSGSLTQVSRAVRTRTMSGPGVPSGTWTYTFGAPGSDGTMHNVVTDPSGNDTLHVISPIGGSYSCSFFETQTVYYQGSQAANNVLKTVNTNYFTNGAGTLDYPDDSALAYNVYPQTVTTILPNGNVSQVVTTQDPGTTPAPHGISIVLGSVISQNEYDYGQGAPGSLIKQTSTTYAWQQSSGNPNAAAYLAANILDAPFSVTVQDASGSRCSETDYTYDESPYLTGTNFGTANQHGPAPNGVRGNATTIKHWLGALVPSSTSCQLQPGSSWSTFVTHTNWYDTGEVYQSIDPLGNVTTYSYDSAYWGAFRTQTQNALGQKVTGTYDFNTGLLNSLTDLNQNTTTYLYDNMFRLTTASFPDGGQTDFQYTDTPGSLSVQEKRLQDTSTNTWVTATTSFDSFGRRSQTSLLDPEGPDVTSVAYDALGRLYRAFNPTRNLNASTPYVQTQYDALGRAILITKQDNSIVRTNYDSNCTTVTDEAGFTRRNCIDGLGRVVEADEPNAASQGVAATASVTISGSLQSTQSASTVSPAITTPISIANYLFNNNDDLYVMDSNGHIYEIFDWPGAWSSLDVTAATKALPAASGSSLSSTFNSSNVKTTVYYVGTDQHLHSLWCCQSGNWAKDDITGESQSPPNDILTNSPIVSYVAGNSEWVYAIGTNQNIYQMYDWPGGWKSANLTWSGAPAAAANSSLAATYNANKSLTSVYFVSSNQHLNVIQCCPNSGNWGNTDISAAPSVSSNSSLSNILTNSPISTYVGNNSEWVYTIGTNENAFQMYDWSGSWGGANLTWAGAPPAGAGSSLASSFNINDWTTNSYYVGNDQHLHRISCCANNGNWGNTDITSSSGAGTANTLGSSPISIANYIANNGDDIYAISTNQHVYEYSDTSPTSSLRAMDVNASTGAPTVALGSTLATSFNPSTWKTNVYYVDANQHLRLLQCCDFGNWTTEDLSSAAAGASDSGIVSLTVGGFTATVCYGNTKNPSCSGQTKAFTSLDVAEGLLQGFNSANSPVTAYLAGTTINLTLKTPGPNPSISSLVTASDNPSLFPNASFTSPAVNFSGGLVGVIDSNAYITKYQYDPIGNLICVEQHGGVSSTGCNAAPSNDSTSFWRIRRFAYDSSGRLLQAKNPESGTSYYAYDVSGNLISKTDARGITVSYSPADSPIDKLNRVTKKEYSNNEPPVSYVYDNGTNGVGHRSSMTDAGGSTTWSYDSMGRVSSELRNTNGITRSVGYQYYVDGETKAITYPNNDILSLAPNYAGRVVSLTDITNGINYVSNATYTPDGQSSSYLNGKTGSFAGILNSFTYDSRLQMENMTSASPTQSLLNIGYDLHFGSGDNGNIWQIINNRDQSRSQTFSYDPLNRLSSAQNAGTACSQVLSNGSPEYWGSAYTYDAWGNLLSKTPQKCASETLSQSVSLLNQINGKGYDTAGNTTSDGTAVYSYNAEGHLSAVPGYSYVYDGDGRRIAKLGTTSLLYWYGASDVLAETDLGGNALREYVFFGTSHVGRRDANGQVYYLFPNHIGSTALITDANGTVQSEFDYYPWGAELPITENLTESHKFTGRERDDESGFHMMGARHYASASGRFTAVDPIWLKPDRLNDPQRLNLYAYARNNPLRFIDPTGLDLSLRRCRGEDAAKCFKLLQQGLRRADRDHIHLVEGDGHNGFAKGEFGIKVDPDYKSDSENFRALQKAANDHSARAVIDVLVKGDTTTLKVGNGWSAKTGTTYSNLPMPITGKEEPFEGYTFFEYRGKDTPDAAFTVGHYSQIVVNATDQSDAEISGTIHHEMRHLVLGDFGRDYEKAQHSPDFNKTQVPRNEADRQTLDAEHEAESNAKQ